MKKKKRGFTLVELLAVIVILAVILVIAVPQIMSVIESARKGSIESTAKLIASSAEREYTNRKILGKDTNVLCTDVASMNSNDYGSCSITFDNAGKATVSITGKGKFEGYTCKGNSTNMECFKGEIPAPTPTDAQYFTYSVVEAGDSESDRTADVTIKDKDKCVAYLLSTIENPSDTDKEDANTLCSGGAIGEFTLEAAVQRDIIPSSDYEAAGIEVKWIIINNVTIKDKDKCVTYYVSKNESEDDANILCSGNALDNGLTLKQDIQKGYIPSSDYETAGLEVTSRPFEADRISITGYNSGFSVEITDQEKCKAYIKTNMSSQITDDSEIETLCTGGEVRGDALDYYVLWHYIPSSNYETAGLKIAYKNGGGADVVIPSEIDGKKVIEIGASAFYRLGIASVVIPDTVTNIGRAAFNANLLSEVTIPSSVTDIGMDAFRNNQLTSITFPTTPIFVGCMAFNNNPITSDGNYTYPDNVTVGGCK